MASFLQESIKKQKSEALLNAREKLTKQFHDAESELSKELMLRLDLRELEDSERKEQESAEKAQIIESYCTEISLEYDKLSDVAFIFESMLVIVSDAQQDFVEFSDSLPYLEMSRKDLSYLGTLVADSRDNFVGEAGFLAFVSKHAKPGIYQDYLLQSISELKADTEAKTSKISVVVSEVKTLQEIHESLQSSAKGKNRPASSVNAWEHSPLGGASALEEERCDGGEGVIPKPK